MDASLACVHCQLCIAQVFSKLHDQAAEEAVCALGRSCCTRHLVHSGCYWLAGLLAGPGGEAVAPAATTIPPAAKQHMRHAFDG